MKALSAFALACLVAIGVALTAQSGRGDQRKIADGDRPNYNRDLAATRYSPLKQITGSNVSTLKKSWSVQLTAIGGGPLGGGSEAVPLVISGVMYAPSGNRVIAIDAATGKDVWQYELPPAPPGSGRGAGQPPRVSTRGLGYGPGDGRMSPRIFFMAGARLTGCPNPRCRDARLEVPLVLRSADSSMSCRTAGARRRSRTSARPATCSSSIA